MGRGVGGEDPVNWAAPPPGSPVTGDTPPVPESVPGSPSRPLRSRPARMPMSPAGTGTGDDPASPVLPVPPSQCLLHPWSTPRALLPVPPPSSPAFLVPPRPPPTPQCSQRVPTWAQGRLHRTQAAAARPRAPPSPPSSTSPWMPEGWGGPSLDPGVLSCCTAGVVSRGPGGRQGSEGSWGGFGGSPGV